MSKQKIALVVVLATLVTGIRFAYVVKSELGINISSRYHAGDLVKVPARMLFHALKAPLS